MRSEERLKAIKEKNVSYNLGGTTLENDWNWLIEQAEKAHLLEHQMNRFEYLASYEFSHQIDNVKGNGSQYQKGALEGMENFNRKWKEATERDIKAMW